MNNLVDRDRAHIWHPYTQMKTAPTPLAIVRGEGVYLYTEDGQRLLDGISSWWVNIHGHSHPKLNAALAAQAAELEHVIFAGFTHRPAIELAEQLVEILPPGLTRVFYSDNGSTAIEAALKMAFQYWQNCGQDQRRIFITLDHAYHGDTVGAMSTSAASAFTSPFQPMLFSVERVSAPYCYQCPLQLKQPSCQIACINSLATKLAELGDRVAGVLIEPMLQGSGGMIVWPSQFLAQVRQLCDQHGTLLIADEVLTGFGRTGKMFACEHAQISPDIICLSKALTGGYLPLAATVAREEIYQAFWSDDRRRTFFHGHSYTANPLGCAVGLASLKLFQTEQILPRIAQLEQLYKQHLAKISLLASVGDTRVIGAVAVIELVSGTDQGYLAQIGPRLAAEFLKRGLLLRPLGNVLYFMPPYVITDAEVAWVFEQIAEVLAQI